MSAARDGDLAIPHGGCLVHIGFDKTGTTALQGAFHRDRDRLRRLGVRYPGTEPYHKSAGIAVTAARGNTGDAAVTMRDWRALTEEVRRARDERVFVSSEWLCRATDAQARRVVDGLGRNRVHVAATLRPLGKILPSAWQQYVKDGFTGDYESWLRGMLLEPPYVWPTPWFWIRHSHDVVLARWASIVGPERVTAIVVDSRDHDLLLRQFEALLELPNGTLVGEPEGKRNASLTYPEAELLRRVNVAFAERGLPDELYAAAVRSGMLPRLADARSDLTAPHPIVTPGWALDRAAEIGATAAAAIAASGIRVLGDLASLGESTTRPADTQGVASGELPIEVATLAQSIVGVLAGTRAERPRPPAPRVWRRRRPVSPLPEF
ncbi:MAG TPA: hypothetical protein VHC43_18330 [Mycobacteriales bacterium]|nr:hypothetical protein [Mycobacteriales bacterium]HVW80680.1 hypothetical protein [Mycobacteriales bacterium]